VPVLLHPVFGLKESVVLITEKFVAAAAAASCRCIDLIDVEDPRVDVCLYCLPPHRLRQNDVR
jgi:hypothetical protein